MIIKKLAAKKLIREGAHIVAEDDQDYLLKWEEIGVKNKKLPK